jgi:hypothetical protein
VAARHRPSRVHGLRPPAFAALDGLPAVANACAVGRPIVVLDQGIPRALSALGPLSASARG